MDKAIDIEATIVHITRERMNNLKTLTILSFNGKHCLMPNVTYRTTPLLLEWTIQIHSLASPGAQEINRKG